MHPVLISELNMFTVCNISFLNMTENKCMNVPNNYSSRKNVNRSKII